MEKEYNPETTKKKKYNDSVLDSLKPAIGEFFSGIGTLFFGNHETSGKKEASGNSEKNTTPIEELKPKIEDPVDQKEKSTKEVLNIYKEFPRKSGESAEAYQIRIRKIRQQREGIIYKTS